MEAAETGTGAGGIVSLGSRFVLEDLEDGTREEYVLVPSSESNPSAGRLSNDSPVGHAVEGRRSGEIVDVRAPLGVRHLRIAAPRPERLAA